MEDPAAREGTRSTGGGGAMVVDASASSSRRATGGRRSDEGAARTPIVFDDSNANDAADGGRCVAPRRRRGSDEGRTKTPRERRVGRRNPGDENNPGRLRRRLPSVASSRRRTRFLRSAPRRGGVHAARVGGVRQERHARGGGGAGRRTSGLGPTRGCRALRRAAIHSISTGVHMARPGPGPRRRARPWLDARSSRTDRRRRSRRAERRTKETATPSATSSATSAARLVRARGARVAVDVARTRARRRRRARVKSSATRTTGSTRHTTGLRGKTEAKEFRDKNNKGCRTRPRCRVCTGYRR